MKEIKNGFTLIELLVVVLIVGILAAVALPQYQKAVLKSRFAAILPVLDGLKKGHESFYLANGYYEADTRNLGIDHPCTGTDVLSCPGGFLIDNLGGSGKVTAPESLFLSLRYCPGKNTTAECVSTPFMYYVYLAHSSYPGKQRCVGKTDEGKTFCKSMCGADTCDIN